MSHWLLLHYGTGKRVFIQHSYVVSIAQSSYGEAKATVTTVDGFDHHVIETQSEIFDELERNGATYWRPKLESSS